MTEPLRILHIDTDKTWRGGQQQVVSLINELHAMGQRNYLVSPPHSEILKRLPEYASACYPIAMRGEWDLLSALRISRILYREKIDIIHAHSGRAHTMALLARRFTWFVPPVVVSRRVNFPIRTNLFSRWKYISADYYIPISQIVANRLADYGIAKDRMSVVYDCTDPRRFKDANREALLQEFQIDPDTLVVGNIAFCDTPKRQIDLLDAVPAVLENVPRVKVVIVGDGPLLEDLKRHANSLGIGDHVIFPGFRQDVGNFHALFDIFVLPSEEEGLGSSILDAQYFGTPVIATPVGGIPEIVNDEETGFLIPAYDPEALAKTIVSLLEQPEKRHQMGALGKKRIEKEFTAQIVAGKTLQVYTTVLAD